MVNTLKNSRGFTLIEVIIYIALFSLLMGTAFISALQLIQGSDNLSAKNVLEEEGGFIMRKINWALTGASAINLPSSGNSGNSLTVTRAGNTVNFTLNGNNLKLGSSELNTVNVSVLPPTTNPTFIFTHTGSGADPEFVVARFRLQTKDLSGQTYSKDFEITKYLRK